MTLIIMVNDSTIEDSYQLSLYMNLMQEQMQKRYTRLSILLVTKDADIIDHKIHIKSHISCIKNLE